MNHCSIIANTRLNNTMHSKAQDLCLELVVVLDDKAPALLRVRLRAAWLQRSARGGVAHTTMLLLLLQRNNGNSLGYIRSR